MSVYLDECKKNGIQPRCGCSGKFKLRIPPTLHEKLAIAAQAEGKRINTLPQEALARRVAAWRMAGRQQARRRWPRR